MPIPFVLSSGFLFIGGILLSCLPGMQPHSGSLILWAGRLLTLLGAIPLLMCYFRSFSVWRQTPPL